MEWAVNNLWLGSTNNWASSVTHWNLVLDEQYGPYHDGCTNCRGTFRFDTSNDYEVVFFETILGHAHYGKYINPDVGATRLDVNVKGNEDCLTATAWKNDDAEAKTMVIVNNFCGQHIDIAIQRGAEYIETTMQNGMATFLFGQQNIVTLVCPYGSVQIGFINADIYGCGTVEGCDVRYEDSYATISACMDGCQANVHCKSFTWAPVGGDSWHPYDSVCTLYDSDIVSNTAGPNQIMCKPVCETGYFWRENGNIAGWGKVDGIGGSQHVDNCGVCADVCTELSNCRSYECVIDNGYKCNLNTEADPNPGDGTDYLQYFCTKYTISAAQSPKLILDAQSPPSDSKKDKKSRKHRNFNDDDDNVLRKGDVCKSGGVETGEPLISVLSIDHKTGKDGEYFNFDAKQMDKILGKQWEFGNFLIFNPRTKEEQNVRMWRAMNGGSKGTAHGRKEPFASKASTDWQIGDELEFIYYECGDGLDCLPKKNMVAIGGEVSFVCQ